MKKTNTSARYKIPNPSWKNVRPIYKKLSDEFHVLTSAYNLKLDLNTKTNLDHLIIVIDEVDNCIDELPEKSQRDSITRSLIHFLANNETSWTHPDATQQLATKMAEIKIIVHQENIFHEFIAAAKAIFHFTEIKRHTKNTDELINYILLEGEATANLPLSILKISNAKPFGIFFTKLCTLMGIADLIFDARSDYKNNLIALKPNLKLYLKLNYIMIIEGVKLLYRFPKKLNFITYCMKFSYALLRS